jgi:hypothetical protein
VADAAQVWGEAFLANHEPTLARRAFERALSLRKCIEHPRVAETEQWLARTG